MGPKILVPIYFLTILESTLDLIQSFQTCVLNHVSLTNM